MGRVMGLMGLMGRKFSITTYWIHSTHKTHSPALIVNLALLAAILRA